MYILLIRYYFCFVSYSFFLPVKSVSVSYTHLTLPTMAVV